MLIQNMLTRRLQIYIFETWSPTLREERRLGMFENRVLRGIFGTKRDEVKVKVKAVCGSYSTAALRHIVLLPE